MDRGADPRDEVDGGPDQRRQAVGIVLRQGEDVDIERLVSDRLARPVFLWHALIGHVASSEAVWERFMFRSGRAGRQLRRGAIDGDDVDRLGDPLQRDGTVIGCPDAVEPGHGVLAGEYLARAGEPAIRAAAWTPRPA